MTAFDRNLASLSQAPTSLIFSTFVVAAILIVLAVILWQKAVALDHSRRGPWQHFWEIVFLQSASVLMWGAAALPLTTIILWLVAIFS